MDFLISIPLYKVFRSVSVKMNESFDNGNNKVDQLNLFVYQVIGKIHKLEIKENTWIILGDFIIPVSERQREIQYFKNTFLNFKTEDLHHFRGNYYLIRINKDKQLVSCFTSMMNILPVYYYVSSDNLYISSRMDLIIKNQKSNFNINKKYFAERLLFGYGFLNNTPWKGIQLLPVNHYLEYLKSQLTIIQHTNIQDFFVTRVQSWKETVNDLAELFIQRAKDYIPENEYYSSFTGGLDSRTLLALGLEMGKNIKSYSYGGEFDKDVKIPRYISEKLNIPYKGFILDESFARHDFMDSAAQSSDITEGNIRFSRAHYNYIASILSKEVEYGISGIFGSELMRTMRMPGNVISQHIFDLFESLSDLKLRNRIVQSSRLKYIQQHNLEKEIDEIANEVIEYKKVLTSGLTQNQRFYTYLIEEIFRKYFGPEIVLENQYLVNRTPFMDFVFIKELLKSELAGCNGNYKENSPFLRFKGQVLYPMIIKKTYPDLLKYKLDRAYTPYDFLMKFGKINIAMGYLKRRLNNTKRYKQPSYSVLCFGENLEELSRISVPSFFVDKQKYSDFFKKGLWSMDYINFINYISFMSYLEEMKNNHSNVRVE